MSMRHQVCFRFQPGTPADQIDALASGLRELPGLIPEIAEYHVGPDLGINDTSWDFAVAADFADQRDYLVYRDHPEHQARIRDLVNPIVAERISVQYEL